MFCSTCGKEVPNEASFCLHCGANLRALSVSSHATLQLSSELNEPAPPPLAAAPKVDSALEDYHVFDWQGVCPACKFVYNSENSPCPNDGSPLVVAFRDHKKPTTWRYPLHAAELRCLNDCGLTVTAFPCSRCGAVVKGKYITFRFPEDVVRRHKAFHRLDWFYGLAGLAIIVAFAYAFYTIGVPKPPMTNEPPDPDAEFRHNVLAYLTFGLAPAFFLIAVSIKCLENYTSKTRFDFTEVSAAAEEAAKQEAIADAIKSAKAVRNATKSPWS